MDEIEQMQGDIEACEDAIENLKFIIKRLLKDLPPSHDWLDHETEKIAKDAVKDMK